MTDCTRPTLDFHPELPVQVAFDAPETSSDGGALLLRLVDEQLKLTARFAPLIPDQRDPTRIKHTRQEQLRQRVYQIALGYEDCNDADSLRLDPVLMSACDVLPDSLQGLSSQPTLSRLENAVDMRSIKALLKGLEEQYLSSFTEPPEVVVLDIDTTDDPTHGSQQLSFFHGFYDQHMYHPMLVFDGVTGQLITAVLRPGNAHAARGAAGVLERIIRALKRRFPEVRVVVRADSGFSVPRVLDRLEQLNAEFGNVDYVLGLAKNSTLLRMGEPTLAVAREQLVGRSYVRHFDAFHYAAQTWARPRLVVMKAELSDKGENPRFVVTSIEGFPPECIYEAYCDRGQCENFIKDFKNALKADRLSCSTFEANFFRLLEHAMAYVLMHALRTHAGQKASSLATVQMDTLRLRLLKVAAHVTRSARRILVRLPRAFPLVSVFCALCSTLSAIST